MSFTRGFCELCLPSLMELQKLIFIRLGSLGYHFEKKKKCPLPLFSSPASCVHSQQDGMPHSPGTHVSFSGCTLINVVKVTMALVQKMGCLRAGPPGPTGLHTEAITREDASHLHRKTKKKKNGEVSSFKRSFKKNIFITAFQFSSVQSLSRVQLFVTP